jgi:preprotein translocase subunit SecE
MELAMIVSLVVFSTVIVLAVIGYAIDRGAGRLEK